MDIAIIGIAGRFPEAGNLDGFYRNLAAGRDSVRPFSRARLRNTGIPTAEEYEIFGYLEDIDLFDHEFFNISLGEAQHMDPHQRLILEVVYETFENAGYNPDFFLGTRTAVFVGDVTLAYSRHANRVEPTLTTGNLHPITAGRIARTFDLRGGALMIDTACSSSLVALHYACNELIHQEADYALACGINIKLFPDNKRYRFDDLGISSPEGKTKSFSAAANGTGSGEAVCAVLLKPYAKALRDKDVIHAVIKGTAINQDAALSGSLTAPSSAAQAEVIRMAWNKAGIDPCMIGYIEAHGTATKLGDPIEVQGISQAFAGYDFVKQHCALGALKTNIGHTAGAAGLASLIKAVLSVRHKKIFPSLHFDAPNPFIDFEDSPVYVNNRLKDWTADGGPRLAGVSSFGFSGTNCHVVLAAHEEEQRQPGKPDTDDPCLITISARTASSLRANMEALREHLLFNSQLELADIAYTLGVGRKHHGCRYAILARTTQALTDGLKHAVFATGEPVAQGRNINRIIFTFSGDSTITPGLIAYFHDRYEVFRQEFDLCRQFAVEATYAPALLRFFFQYAFFKLLVSAGIKSDVLLGEGNGELVVAVLTGRSDMQSAVGKVMAGKPPQYENIQERCAALLANVGAEPVIFAEMGPWGTMMNALQEQIAGNVRYGMAGVDAGQEDKWPAYLRDLYLAGFASGWGSINAFPEGRRIELPTYRFEKKRCWIDPVPLVDYREYAWELSWKRSDSAGAVPANEPPAKCFLVFMDNAGCGENLTTLLTNKGHRCIKVWPGQAFEDRRDDSYIMDPASAADHLALKLALDASGTTISDVIHLGGCNILQDHSPNLERLLDEGLNVHTAFINEFADRFENGITGYTAVTCCARSILAEEEPVYPGRAASHGLLVNLKEQYPSVRVKSIDISGHDASWLAEVIAGEALGADDYVSIAYRNRQRYLPEITRKPLLPVTGSRQTLSIDTGATYLVTAGTSAVGLELCKHLAQHKVRLVITDTPALPVKDSWEETLDDVHHPFYHIIKSLVSFERDGTEVQYYATDLAKENDLANVLAIIAEQYGAITGIFHLEAFTGNKDPLSLLQGTDNLLELAANPNGWMIGFTSYHTIIGAEGKASPGIGGIFAEACAEKMATQFARHMIIKWPEWRMGASGEEESTGSAFCITKEEALALLEQLMGTGWSHVIISPANPLMFGDNPYFLAAAPVIPAAAAENGQKAAPPHPPVEEAGRPVTREHMDWTDTENHIYQVWKEVLKISDAGLDDDFFDIGGHSLNGIQISNKIEKEFNVPIEFDDLLDHSTIRTLALHLDTLSAAATSKSDADEDTLTPVEKGAHYAPSHSQQRLWILHQLEKNMIAYNMSAAYDFEGIFDAAVFTKAFQALVERHEILRTTFVTVDGALRQKIHDTGAFNFEMAFKECAAIDSEGEDVISTMILEDARMPFDLEQGPLIRATLLKLGPARHLFFFTVHHIIGDGWSLKVLQRDLTALYEAFSENRDNPLPPLKIQYKDFAAWQNRLLDGSAMDVHRQYWNGQFRDVPAPLEWQGANARPEKRTYAGERVTFIIEQETADRLKEMSRRNDATLFMTILSTIKALVFRYTKQEDIVIGTPASGRHHAALEDQIGFYLNMLAIRTRFNAGDGFETVLGRVREIVQDAYRHQAYPFDRLLEDLDLSVARNRNALFDLGCTFNNFTGIHIPAGVSAADSHPEDVSVRAVNTGYTTVKADIWFLIYDGPGDIRVNVDYNNALFSAAFIKRFVSEYQLILRLILETPGISLNDLCLRLDEQVRDLRRHKQKELKGRNAAALKAGLLR